MRPTDICTYCHHTREAHTSVDGRSTHCYEYIVVKSIMEQEGIYRQCSCPGFIQYDEDRQKNYKGKGLTYT